MNELFSAFGIDGRMLTVQIVNFSILLFVLWYLLYRPLVAFIDKRRDEIIESVSNADKAKHALASAVEKRAERLAEASKEATAIVAMAKQSATEKETAILEKAKEQAARVTEEATATAEELKRRSLAESKEEIARMIIEGAERALREKAGT